MQKVISPVGIALALTLALAACANAPPAEGGIETLRSETSPTDIAPEYLLRHFVAQVPLAENQTKDPHRIVIDLALFEVSGPPAEARFFNGLLYAGSSPEQYRDALIREYLAMYRATLEPATDVPPAPADWEHLETVELNALQDRGLVLGRTQYVYTGGAHGMQTTTWAVIDRHELRTLSLADFFREPEGAELRAIVRDELRRYSGLEQGRPLSEGIFFEDEPPLSADFYITGQGLVLHWDPYEIAPYSEGGIEISLPWKTIRPLLRIDAMERLATFGIYLFM
jgi:hypothetical protein